MAEYRDLYGPVPLRLIDALKRREVTLDGFAIVAFFCGECFRSGNHEAVYTLGGLADALGYRKSADTLSRELKALRPEWIEFETRRGQRTPIVFALTGARVEFGVTSAREGRSRAEVADDERRWMRKSEHDGNGAVDGEHASSSDSRAEVAAEVSPSNLISSSKTSMETTTSMGAAPPQALGPRIEDDCPGCGERRPMAFNAHYCDDCTSKSRTVE